MKIIKNDKVLVTKGKDRGKISTVSHVFKKTNKVVLTGLNKFKKHIKPSKLNPQGGIVDIESPISISNVIIICPSCNKQTRIGYQILKDKKIRICKKCGQSITK